MNICGKYSFRNKHDTLGQEYALLLSEIEDIIGEIDASECKINKSRQNAVLAHVLYNPKRLRNAFKKQFLMKAWQSKKVTCDCHIECYKGGYNSKSVNTTAFREMDFVKERLGVEIQFSRCMLPIYSGCAKMTIFHKLGFIDAGVEIVPTKNFADEMSTGVSYFEQFVWDLEHRGVSDIDIPVLILGVDK
jgi:hypothetical protein